MVRSIVSKIATSKTPSMWKEDIFAFIALKDFQLTSLGVLHIGFEHATIVGASEHNVLNIPYFIMVPLQFLAYATSLLMITSQFQLDEHYNF